MNKELAVKTEWQETLEKANKLVASKFLPVAINTPEKAVAIAMMGKELGLGMMESFRSINVIQGKPTMSVALMLALAQSKGNLVDQKIEAFPDRQNPTNVRYTVTRKGQSPHIEEFGDAEARAMGLLGKDNYKKQKFTMYRWRVIGNALRMVFGDVLHGVYTPEELGAEIEVIDDEMKVVKLPPEQQTIKPPPPEAAAIPPENRPVTPDIEKMAPNKKGIYVKSVTDRTAKNKKPYAWIESHVDKNEQEEKYFCYSQSAIAILKTAEDTAEMVEIYYEVNNYGAKIHHAVLVNDAMGQDDGENGPVIIGPGGEVMP